MDGRRTRCACTRATSAHEVDEELASRIRASFLLAGPLLARLGRANVPPPGGDVIGRRRLDPHIHAFAELGAKFEHRRALRAPPARLRGAHVLLDEASVMATENAVMAAVARAGRDGDLERRVRAARAGPLPLPRLARRADRRASGRTCFASPASTRLGGGEHAIGPEHIEVGSFIGLAAVTGGDVTIEGVEPDDLWPILPAFERLGVDVELGDDRRAGAARAGARGPRRPRRHDPEDRGRPVARVPGRPDLDRRRRRDAGAGHGPDLREDVREPPVLRRQARRRWARGSSSATRTASSSPGRAPLTASGCRAPTSAPEWRC